MIAATKQIPLFEPRALFPVQSAFDVHAVSLPARTFTGDFWFTHRTDDRLWFALGDVSGKGLPAALVMAIIQEELEQRITSCARAGCDPATTMQRLHTLLRPILPGNRFATAVIGWLCDDGTLTLVNAGHCPPLVVRAGGAIEQIDSTGPVVGIVADSRWRSVTHKLRRGDMLVLYSDGLSEAACDGGIEFGTEGIENALRDATRPHSARGVAAHLLAAVDRHADGVRNDDLTLLVIGRG
ncbi:MAG: phosphoserine phosphatase RsbU/P [Acidobacteriota bacterium]|jgi:sigma-B regulation protein RsbU (phosphoserine phosphatase)|nr:phosphoserine phosphatase RsbU/P [Acidobacteriota bacterium]